MKTIWKYTLNDLGEECVLQIPKGGEILDIQLQGTDLQMWVLVESQNELKLRSFSIYGTGHRIRKDSGVFLKTFQLPELGLVFHVFENIK